MIIDPNGSNRSGLSIAAGQMMGQMLVLTVISSMITVVPVYPIHQVQSHGLLDIFEDVIP